MRGLVLAVFCALVACTIGLPSVLRFAVDNEEHTKLGRHSRLTGYQFKNCAPPAKEKFVLSSLTIGPDPLSFPGPLEIAFSGQIKDSVDAPLKASVYLGKKVGSTWVKIPCIGSIGSCTYDDICNFLNSVTCPDPLVRAGIPCQCPFKPGNYTLPKASFDVEAALFPAGDYHGQANLTVNNNLVTCVDIMVTFE